MNRYFQNLLSQILAGDQEELSNIIDSYFEIEDSNFFELSIKDAIVWLEDNYDNYKEYIS